MDVENFRYSGALLQKMACCSVLHTIMHAQRCLLLLLFLSCQLLSDIINTFLSHSVRFPYGDLQKALLSRENKDSGESDDDDEDADDSDDDKDGDEDDDSEDGSEDDDSDDDSDNDVETSDEEDDDDDDDEEDEDDDDDDDDADEDDDSDSDEEGDTTPLKRK